MVRTEQIKDGFETFCVNEIQPHLTMTKGFVFGTVIGILLTKFDNVVNWFKTQPLIGQLDILDSNNNVDDELLFGVIKKQAERNSVIIEFPVIGTVTFTPSDIDKLHRYIRESRA